MAKVMIELDLENPVQRQLYDDWHRDVTSSVPAALIRRLRGSQTYREFLRPVAEQMTPGTEYRAEDLGNMLTPPRSPKQVAAAFAKIGKPEKRFGQKVVQRRKRDGGGLTRYSITAEVREALLADDD